MDVFVGAGKIAQRLPDAVSSCLEHEPFVSRPLHLLQRHGETEFEWHVEPRDSRRRGIELDSREVVERIAAASEKTEDPIQPALTSRDLKGCVGDQRESAQSGQEREEQLFVPSVVGNVEECRIRKPASAELRRRAAGSHLWKPAAQERAGRVEASAARFVRTLRPAPGARLWRRTPPALRSRLWTMASISPATRFASAGDSPISRAVSSRDGAGAVIRTLRGIAVRYVGQVAGVNSAVGQGRQDQPAVRPGPASAPPPRPLAHAAGERAALQGVLRSTRSCLNARPRSPCPRAPSRGAAA